jgi:hypothetical protein
VKLPNLVSCFCICFWDEEQRERRSIYFSLSSAFLFVSLHWRQYRSPTLYFGLLDTKEGLRHHFFDDLNHSLFLCRSHSHPPHCCCPHPLSPLLLNHHHYHHHPPPPLLDCFPSPIHLDRSPNRFFFEPCSLCAVHRSFYARCSSDDYVDRKQLLCANLLFAGQQEQSSSQESSSVRRATGSRQRCMFKRDNNSNSGSDNDTAPLMSRNTKSSSSGASDDPFHAVRE